MSLPEAEDSYYTQPEAVECTECFLVQTLLMTGEAKGKTSHVSLQKAANQKRM